MAWPSVPKVFKNQTKTEESSEAGPAAVARQRKKHLEKNVGQAGSLIISRDNQ